MAKIIENHEGRRMIRLSTDDVLTVVSLYQQQLYQLQQMIDEGETAMENAPPKSQKVRKELDGFQFYLPEDPQ
jgi:hypothetical protein